MEESIIDSAINEWRMKPLSFLAKEGNFEKRSKTLIPPV